MFSFFKVNELISKQDYLELLLLIISSVLISFAMVPFIISILHNEIYFNIFSVIPIQYWIGIFLLTIVPTALIRPLLLGIIAKLKFNKLYFKKMIFHILKYGFISMPFIMPVILILGNNIVLNIVQINTTKTLFIGLLYMTVFLIIWILFLGTTIVKFLRHKFSLLISIIINLSTSSMTTLIITLFSFNYFTNIDKYELLFVKKAIHSLQKTGKLSNQKANYILREFKIKGEQ